VPADPMTHRTPRAPALPMLKLAQAGPGQDR